MRRRSIGLVGAALVLAACGASDSSESDSAPAEAPAAAPADEAPADEPVPEPTEAPTTEAPATTAAPEEPADEPIADEAEPAPAPEPAPEPAGPEPAPIGGRDLGAELLSASATDSNPLPDLLVDDVSRGTQVNLANAIPSARPLLVWAWAPH